MKTRFSLFLLAAFALVSSCSKNDDSDDQAGGINPLDSRYRVEGTLTDAVNATYTWPGSTYEYSLQATSATQATLIPKDLGIAGHLIRVGGSLSYYSQFGLIVTMDKSTNKITSITNYYGQPSPSGRSAVLDPSGVNAWDPATKNIRIKYWMDEGGSHRTSFDETWVYLGAR